MRRHEKCRGVYGRYRAWRSGAVQLRRDMVWEAEDVGALRQLEERTWRMAQRLRQLGGCRQ